MLVAGHRTRRRVRPAGLGIPSSVNRIEAVEHTNVVPFARRVDPAILRHLLQRVFAPGNSRNLILCELTMYRG